MACYLPIQQKKDASFLLLDRHSPNPFLNNDIDYYPTHINHNGKKFGAKLVYKRRRLSYGACIIVQLLSTPGDHSSFCTSQWSVKLARLLLIRQCCIGVFSYTLAPTARNFATSFIYLAIEVEPNPRGWPKFTWQQCLMWSTLPCKFKSITPL